MRKSKEFLGSVSIKSDPVIRAGIPCSVELTYTVGKYGYDDTSTIVFYFYGTSDWQMPPQTSDPNGFGYSTVKTNANAKVRILSDFVGARPYEQAIKIQVYDGCLKEGDKVILTLGDRSFGSLGVYPQTYTEKSVRIKTAVDPFNMRQYQELPESCYLDVINGAASEINVVLPSTVKPNQAFEIGVRILDDFGNACKDFIGTISLSCPENFVCEQTEIKMTEENKGTIRIKAMIKEAGEYRIRGIMDDYGISCISNVCVAKDNHRYQLYWGDMHGQCKDVGTKIDLDNYFEFPRDVAFLDFSGWQGNDFEVSDAEWKDVCEKIKKYHDPDHFITFLGYEWSGVTSGGGDYNIYFLNDDQTINRTCMWKGLPDDDGSECYPLTELWDRFKGRKDVIAIPHVGGRHGNFDFYNPEFVKMIEVHSHHGTFEWMIEEAMRRKMKVAFIASSDDHTQRVGLSYPTDTDPSVGVTFDVKSGFTAVYADRLTRESIWDAFQKRRCYGTTSSRIMLDYNIDGHIMGEECVINNDKADLSVEVHGNAPIDNLQLFNGTELVERFDTGKIIKDSEIKRIKIVWSGVRTRYRRKSVNWDGDIIVDNGTILNAENYSIDKKSNGIQWFNGHKVHVISNTSGDEDGIILTIHAKEDCRILFRNPQQNVTLNIKEIIAKDFVLDLGEENRKIVIKYEQEKRDINDLSTYSINHVFKEIAISKDGDAYFVKVTQSDGHIAWGAPIYIKTE